MPCESGPSNNDYDRLKALADKATRAACDMRTVLRRHKLLRWLTKETRGWISQHDLEDADRIAQEEAAGIRQTARVRGLSKLTLEERRALGL